jgi:hypothetical protein
VLYVELFAIVFEKKNVDKIDDVKIGVYCFLLGKSHRLIVMMKTGEFAKMAKISENCDYV